MVSIHPPVALSPCEQDEVLDPDPRCAVAVPPTTQFPGWALLPDEEDSGLVTEIDVPFPEDVARVPVVTRGLLRQACSARRSRPVPMPSLTTSPGTSGATIGVSTSSPGHSATSSYRPPASQALPSGASSRS